MPSNLKNKTVSGLIWSFVDNFATYGITFLVGIILARLLTPTEFGLIGMTTIFIAVSTSVIDSGFSQALIRKKNCTEIDYSTVFYFNFAVGLVFFSLLYFAAPFISDFFDEPQLSALVRVLAILLIIDSLTIIQRTTLTKRVDFKLQTKISVIAGAITGGIAIAMAFWGFGVWSLVVRQISLRVLNSLFLWYWNRWRPHLVFSLDSLKELFSFGSKLLISGLIDTVHKNIYMLVIGKFFSASDLGFFTRAQNFKNLPSQHLTRTISRVTYPVLSSIQDDIPRLKSSYQKLIRSTMFITFVLMLGMAAVAEPMIIGLIGEKWRPSIMYLQMLCFIGMFYPLHSLNLNMLKVQGHSDIFLRLEIIKKSLTVPVILIGINYGIKHMIAAMMVNTVIAYYLNSYYSGKMIGYSVKDQIIDVFPSFLVALFVSISVFIFGFVLPFGHLLKLGFQVSFGAILTLIVCETIKFKDYVYIKGLFFDKFSVLRSS